jgi:TonB family protein
MIHKLLFLILISTTTAFAQNQTNPSPTSTTDNDSKDTTKTQIEPVLIATTMPYFTGCKDLKTGTEQKRSCSNQAMATYIAKHLEITSKETKEGTVYIRFEVDTLGKVTEPKIVRGIGTIENEAALKVVQNMPNWEPATENGEKIKVQLSLPIRFASTGEKEWNNPYQLTWGTLKGKAMAKADIVRNQNASIVVRDDKGNFMDITQLMVERKRGKKFVDAVSNLTTKGTTDTKMTPEMKKIINHLKAGDQFTLTVTVQKSGQLYYVEQSYLIN